MDDYKSAADLAFCRKPYNPVFCLRPHAVARAAHWFKDNLSGKTLFAVKANPAPWVIELMRAAGLGFDVASIDEARLVRSLAPEAFIAFMHPIKAREAIAEAYFELGVRAFSLDTIEELRKIEDATGGARDLTLCVRIAVSSDMSKISLASKFGADEAEAAELLQHTRQIASRLGVCFHVGSQAMSPQAFAGALDRVERAVVRAGVIVDVLDVGGGFPAPYPGMIAPPLADYARLIEERFERMLVAETCELWSEPGRALCAEGASLVVRVEARKGDQLYINDGVYGALFDAGSLNWVYPTRVLREQERPNGVTAFSFYGPTCDDHDRMIGPFYLPDDITVGDYIEIGNLGAYGAAMATRFNGFGAYEACRVYDEALLSAYIDGSDRVPAETGASVHLSAPREEQNA